MALASEPAIAQIDDPPACGIVSFYASGPMSVDGTTYREHILAVLMTSKERRKALFPYEWTYPSGEANDPWSTTNLQLRYRWDIRLQRPPIGTDVARLEPLIQFILQSTDADGLTTLRPCPIAAHS